MEKISFVIPCYNSELTICDVVSEIIEQMRNRNDYDYEVILVNDFSKDNVWHVINTLCLANNRIKAISFSKNFGQQSALLAGYRHVSGDLIVSLDDDGQSPLDALWLMVDKLNDGNYDVVYGCYEKTMQKWYRRSGSYVNRKMGEFMLSRPKELNPTSFFVVKRYVIDEVCKFKNCYAYISGLIFRTTQNIGGVLVKHRARTNGTSGYTLKRLVNLWINGFTAFSVKPLRLSTLLGFITAGVGFMYGIYIIILRLIYPDVPSGYASLMSVILFIGGMIMFLLGMLGEYVGRIYINQNNAPQYVIKKTINL